MELIFGVWFIFGAITGAIITCLIYKEGENDNINSFTRGNISNRTRDGSGNSGDNVKRR